MTYFVNFFKRSESSLSNLEYNSEFKEEDSVVLDISFYNGGDFASDY